MALKRRAGGPAGRRAALVLAVALGVLSATQADTQESPRARPWPVETAHIMKWPGLAATGTMLTLGFLASRDAARWHDELNDACVDLTPCPPPTTDPHFVTESAAAAQRAFGAYEAANARARNWILGGEIALVATGAMFLVDLINRSDAPRNIPFTPFTVYAAPRRLGLTAGFSSGLWEGKWQSAN